MTRDGDARCKIRRYARGVAAVVIRPPRWIRRVRLCAQRCGARAPMQGALLLFGRRVIPDPVLSRDNLGHPGAGVCGVAYEVYPC